VSRPGHAEGEKASYPEAGNAAYDRDEIHEFVRPTVIGDYARIAVSKGAGRSTIVELASACAGPDPAISVERTR
jgi:hypothetical protein